MLAKMVAQVFLAYPLISNKKRSRGVAAYGTASVGVSWYARAWSDGPSDALGSLTLDGIFQVTRAALQLRRSYRWDDARAACLKVLALAASRLNDASFVFAHFANTTHDLPNIVAAAAECAQTFPEDVLTDRPWACCARYV